MVTLGVVVVVVDDVIGVAVFSVVVSKTMSSIVVVLIDVVGGTVVVVADVVVVVAVVVFIVVGEGVAGCTEPSDENSTTTSKHYNTVNILLYCRLHYTNVCLPKTPKRSNAENVLFCLFYFYFFLGGGREGCSEGVEAIHCVHVANILN